MVPLRPKTSLFFTVNPLNRHLFNAFICLSIILSLAREAKSSTKAKDEASPFNYLHVFIVSLYFNPSFNVMNVRFNSIL